MRFAAAMKGLARIIPLATIILATSQGAFADGEMKGQVQNVKGYGIELAFMNNPVVVGKNQIMIRLKDAMMAPVDGAMVTTSAKMDESMKMDSSAMSNQKPIALTLMRNPDVAKKGEYMADIQIPYEGKWIVDVTVQVGSETLSATFDVEVGSSGPNMAIVGAFIGLIAIVIIVAGVNKARGKKEQAPKA